MVVLGCNWRFWKYQKNFQQISSNIKFLKKQKAYVIFSWCTLLVPYLPVHSVSRICGKLAENRSTLDPHLSLKLKLKFCVKQCTITGYHTHTTCTHRHMRSNTQNKDTGIMKWRIIYNSMQYGRKCDKAFVANFLPSPSLQKLKISTIQTSYKQILSWVFFRLSIGCTLCLKICATF